MNQPTEVPEKKRPFIEPGWHRGIPNKDYHGSFGIGSTTLKTLVEQTPAHLLYKMTHPQESTPAMALGTAVHSMVLEPDTADDQIIVMPADLNLRTAKDKAVRDALLMEADESGAVVITAEQFEVAKQMADSVLSHPMASALLADGIPESSVYWWYKSMDPDDDTQYKEMLKVRPDMLSAPHGVIVDLKTTRDASYTGFMKQVMYLSYHLSAAMYLEGVNRCKPLLLETGHLAYTNFVFVCVENTPPYATACYELSDDFIEYGKGLYRRALMSLRSGRENQWPAYPEEIRTLEPPPWASRMHVV